MKQWLYLILIVAASAIQAAPPAAPDGMGVPFERHFTETRLDSTGYKATLTLPADIDGRRPGVLLIGGNASGMRDRDETVSKSRLFRDVAEMLAAEGYVVLRYEPSPSGIKDTRPMLSAIEKDARKGFDTLRARPEVDPSRILLVSHDTGDVAAFTLAREFPRCIKGIATLSAPMRQGDEILVKRDEALLTFAGALLTDTHHDILVKLYEAVRKGNRDEIAEVLYDNYEILQIPPADIPARLDELTSPSMLEYARTDFGSSAAGLHTPLFSLYGEWDLINDPTANIVMLKRRNQQARVRRIEGASHMLQYIGDPYRPIPCPYTSPEALRLISAFAKALL